MSQANKSKLPWEDNKDGTVSFARLPHYNFQATCGGFTIWGPNGCGGMRIIAYEPEYSHRKLKLSFQKKLAEKEFSYPNPNRPHAASREFKGERI